MTVTNWYYEATLWFKEVWYSNRSLPLRCTTAIVVNAFRGSRTHQNWCGFVGVHPSVPVVISRSIAIWERICYSNTPFPVPRFLYGVHLDLYGGRCDLRGRKETPKATLLRKRISAVLMAATGRRCHGNRTGPVVTACERVLCFGRDLT